MTDSRKPARRRPTIDDVARRAGVSSAAVSFAMNGRRGVGEATRARILDAAAELGWSPSAPARALGRGRAGAIGLLLARPVETLEVDPFFLRFLAGVERGLATHGPRAAAARARRRRARSTRRRTRGSPRRAASTASCSATSSSTTRASRCSRTPGCPSWSPATRRARARSRALETRHAEGLAEATAHLVERGHERIGFLGGRRPLRVRAGAPGGLAAASWRARAWSRARSRSATRPRAVAGGRRRSSAPATCSPRARSPRARERGPRGARRPRDRRLRRLQPLPRSPRRR